MTPRLDQGSTPVAAEEFRAHVQGEAGGTAKEVETSWTHTQAISQPDWGWLKIRSTRF